MLFIMHNILKICFYKLVKINQLLFRNENNICPKIQARNYLLSASLILLVDRSVTSLIVVVIMLAPFFQRFTKNFFVQEKNPTIVNFAIK